ncbi:mitotic checkpoint regulator, MAD2B-interacting-domain-containing protein [Lipomyces orientalis]|uniref:Mitotic checkpoint regulator, MAD2B-interacting-domain-containing protein n=1 Tax=Lipomyces orientalis TaxID=1233043 RepID=A0ACC3TRP9_9ASCO
MSNSSPDNPDTPVPHKSAIKRTKIQPFFAVKKSKNSIKSSSLSEKDSRTKGESDISDIKDVLLSKETNADFKREEKRTATADGGERDTDTVETNPKKKRKSQLAGMSLDLGLVNESEKRSQTPSHINTLGGVYKPIMLPDMSEVATNSVAQMDEASNGQVSDSTSLPVERISYVERSLDSIAKEVGLSDSTLQILEGRHRRTDRPIRVVDYNVDDQYEYNQSIIASGAAQSVQPVRSIGSGKHQLRGLINSATQQRESLEEAFASGRRNKRESGAKYGF